MKTVIFDNRSFVGDRLRHIYPQNEILELNKNSFEDFISRLLFCEKEKDLVFYINLNTQITGKPDLEFFSDVNNSDSSLNGVVFLTWLRINRFLHHCVIYSFETQQSILKRHPEKMIICSPGTSYYRLPFDPANIPINKLRNLNSSEQVKPYLKPAVDKSFSRHEHASWWGIKQLYYVHFIFNEKISFNGINKAYPEKIRILMSRPQNQIMTFLNDIENKKLRNIANKNEVWINRGDFSFDDDGYLIMAEEKKRENYIKAISDLNKYLSERVIPKIVLFDDNFDIGFSDILVRMIYTRLISDSNAKINTKIKEKPIIFKKQITLIGKEYSIIKDNNVDWEPVFYAVKDTSEKYRKVIDNNFDFFEYLIEEKNFYPDLLMLDLRLMNERGHLSWDDTTGAQVFQKIRNHDFTIPILITTASNKINSFRNLMMIGADEYWIKEGIDENRTPMETIDNYYRLLYKIFTLTRRDFKIRTKLNRLITEIEKSDTKYWWEEKDWQFEDPYDGIDRITKADRKQILTILKEIQSQYHLLVFTKTVNYMDVVNRLDHELFGGLFVSSGKIVELVHDINKIKRKRRMLKKKFRKIKNKAISKIIYDPEGKINSRNDSRGNFLYTKRHLSAHHKNSSRKLDFRDLLTQLDNLCSYLNNNRDI